MKSIIPLIKELQERGLVAQITNENTIEKKISKHPISLYCGFDPTSDSLHIGHLIPLFCLRRFQKMGHKPFILVGGATGLIGDPSFKISERKLHKESTVQMWVDSITKQFYRFLDFDCGNNSAIVVNNYDWFSKMNILTFLRDIGKYFPVNHIINKRAVQHRLIRDKNGLSFTEFSYNLLQGYDFFYLNKIYDVILQIGGSDQWGNITTGIALTRRINKTQTFGLTMPLVTKNDGTKFGKTESGSVWLDAKKTSPYKFYQFWINISDDEVFYFLRFFTFISIEEINSLELDVKNKKRTISPQRILADQVTRLVHGKEGLSSAKRITQSLFSDQINNLNESDFKQLKQDGMPMIEVERGIDLSQALVRSLLQPSLGQARKIISANAISINGKKQTNPLYIFSSQDYLFEKYTLICRGKKNFCLICWK